MAGEPPRDPDGPGDAAERLPADHDRARRWLAESPPEVPPSTALTRHVVHAARRQRVLRSIVRAVEHLGGAVLSGLGSLLGRRTTRGGRT